MKRNIIYLSGPITTGGYDVKENRKRFNQHATRLEKLGYVVLNPAMLPMGLEENHYMDIACAMLRSADSVYMLDFWSHSDGSSAEYALAVKLRKSILFESEDNRRLSEVA